jgi:transposase-like protein
MNTARLELFPCPFCRSDHVCLIGSARSFLHYRCVACEEVWTAMRVPAATDPANPLQKPSVGSRDTKPTFH